VAEAVGEWVLVTDADLATPLDQLPALAALAHEGADVIIASATSKGRS